jgi:3-hydroxybutyryl-CoA dehydrogenase
VHNIETVGVVGAGLMGAGIAQVLATSGFAVILNDQNENSLAQAQTSIRGRIDRLAEKGQLTATEASAAKERLRISADLEEMSAAQLVIEAVVERLDVKQTLFQRLEEIVADEAILASNTSSLLIAAIGRNCRRPERVCGLHFFNPVPLLKLVEVIRGPFTKDAVVERALAVMRQIGKVPVMVKDSPGFLVNLAGRAYYTEALHIEAEGVATPDQIDRIMKVGGGFRMGPFELMDLTGIDTNYPVTTFIHERFQYDPRLKTTPLHGYMVEAGRTGRKAGRGFYDYREELPKLVEPPATSTKVRFSAFMPETGSLDPLGASGLMGVADDGALPILVNPLGEDATGIVHRLSLDPSRTVAIDLSMLDRRLVTVMTPPGTSQVLDEVVAWLGSIGLHVEIINDSAGFVGPRIIAMIVNLCSEIAQTRIAVPEDIGTALTLGLNYPFDPLERGDAIGPAKLLRMLSELQSISGSDRYRPSLWLRRRALTGLSLRQQ